MTDRHQWTVLADRAAQQLMPTVASANSCCSARACTLTARTAHAARTECGPCRRWPSRSDVMRWMSLPGVAADLAPVVGVRWPGQTASSKPMSWDWRVTAGAALAISSRTGGSGRIRPRGADGAHPCRPHRGLRANRQYRRRGGVAPRADHNRWPQRLRPRRAARGCRGHPRLLRLLLSNHRMQPGLHLLLPGACGADTTPRHGRPMRGARPMLGALGRPDGRRSSSTSARSRWPERRSASCSPGRAPRPRRRGRPCRASIQTNGTTLDEDLADFLADHDVAVGISLDGPREVHDAARVFPQRRRLI